MQSEKENNKLNSIECGKSTEHRQKRIHRLKIAIIIVVLTFMIVPTIFCIILGVQVYRLKKEVEQLSEVNIEYDLERASTEASISSRDTLDITGTIWQQDTQIGIQQPDDQDSLIKDEKNGEMSNWSGDMKLASSGEDLSSDTLQLEPSKAAEQPPKVNKRDNVNNIENSNKLAENAAAKIDKSGEAEASTDKNRSDKAAEKSNKEEEKQNKTEEQEKQLAGGQTDISFTDQATGLNNSYHLAGKYNHDEIASLSTNIYQGKSIYLTFDDGPSVYTDEILDILADYNVKATFFVVGKSDKTSKRLYQRIVDEGHTLGMHSYSHVYKKIYNSLEDFDKDFTKLWKLLYDTTGYKPTIYRFPGGSDNPVNKKRKELIRYLNEKSIVYYDWNVLNGDATGVMYDKEQLIDNVLTGLTKKKKCIVLLHDSQSKKTTVDSLPGLLEALIFGNAELLPLDEKVPPIQMIKADSVK